MDIIHYDYFVAEHIGTSFLLMLDCSVFSKLLIFALMDYITMFCLFILTFMLYINSDYFVKFENKRGAIEIWKFNHLYSYLYIFSISLKYSRIKHLTDKV